MSVTKAKRAKAHPHHQTHTQDPLPSEGQASALPEGPKGTEPLAPCQCDNLSPTTLPKGSLPVHLGPDGNSVIVHTWAGRDIWLLPTEQGMATLIKLLDIENKRTKPQSHSTPSRPLEGQVLGPIPLPKRFTPSGKRLVTLDDLGL